MKKVFSGIVFFIGWVLSPFTWWNDIFVNIPLSYILANIVYYFTRIRFGWLVISAYWFTNVLGIVLMLLGGSQIADSGRHKLKTAAFLFIAILVYSFIMFYLTQRGKLLPISAYFVKRS